MDFEPLARKELPPAGAILATGVDDDVTLRANREAFGLYQLRPRRLVDISSVDLKAEILGTTWDMPIYVSAVAAGCPVRNCLFCHKTAPALGGTNPQVNLSKPMFAGLGGHP